MIFLKKIFIFALFLTLLVSCNKKETITESIYINLDETNKIEIDNTWGVIKYSVNLRSQPTDEVTNIINHLKKGALVEILRKENKVSDFDNKFDYWYYINYTGEVGWVFGSYLEIFNSKTEAIKRSEQYLFNKN